MTVPEERAPARQRIQVLRGVYLAQTSLVVLTRIVAYSWFLAELGSQKLGLVYILQAIPLCLLTIFLMGLVDRVGRAQLLIVLNVLYLAGVVGALIGIRAGVDGLSLYFLLFGETAISLFGMYFWLLASELLTPHQAKRHFPSLALVGALGALLSGGIIQILPVMAPRTLLWLLLPPSIAFAGLAWYVHSRFGYRVGPRRGRAQGHGPIRELAEGLSLLRTSPLMRWLAVLTAAITSVGLLIDFLYNATADAGWSPEQLPAFFGGVQMVVSILQVGLVLTLGSRIFTTFGLSRTLSTYPAGSLVLAAGGLAVGAGWPLIGLKIFDRLENYIILNPGIGIALNGFPREHRGRASIVYGGLIKPIAIAATGLALHFTKVPRDIILIVTLLLLGLFFWVLQRLKVAYREALVTNLHSSDRRLVSNSIEALAEPENRMVVSGLLKFASQTSEPAFVENIFVAAGKIRDPRFVPILLEGLKQSHLSLKCAAAKALAHFPTPQVRDALISALKNEEASRVKASILGALTGEIELAELHAVLKAGLADRDARVRANAIEAIGLTDDPALIGELKRFLKSSSPRVAANAAVALARSPRHRSDAVVALQNILESGETAMLVSALYAAGEVAEPALLPWLLNALQSDNLDLRRNAAIALAKLDEQASVDPLLEVLKSSKEGGWSVAQNLDRFGSAVRERLIEGLSALQDEERARALSALRSCGANYLDELEQIEFLTGAVDAPTPSILLDTTSSQS